MSKLPADHRPVSGSASSSRIGADCAESSVRSRGRWIAPRPKVRTRVLAPMQQPGRLVQHDVDTAATVPAPHGTGGPKPTQAIFPAVRLSKIRNGLSDTKPI